MVWRRQRIRNERGRGDTHDAHLAEKVTAGALERGLGRSVDLALSLLIVLSGELDLILCEWQQFMGDLFIQ